MLDPLPRPPYPTVAPATMAITKSGRLRVNGEIYPSRRIGVAILIYARHCKCGNCVPCQVGKRAIEVSREIGE